MIEYLEKLLQDKDYEKVLAYAEHLLMHRENNPGELALIHSAVLDGRVHLGEYSGAVVAGELALRLGRETCQWDCFGAACMNLGAAYYYLRDWDQAIRAWLEFLTALSWYQKCSQFEAQVRYNLGLAQTANGDFAQACHSMEQALLAAAYVKDEPLAHGIRLALVGSLLKAGKLITIPRLLAQCGRYIRGSRGGSQLHVSELWYIGSRIEYMVASHRLYQARRLALRAVLHPDGRSDHKFSFHMILAKIGRQRGCENEALAHSLAARIHANRCHRQDLQSEADGFMYELTIRHSGVIQAVDQYLLDSVLPIEEELDSHT